VTIKNSSNGSGANSHGTCGGSSEVKHCILLKKNYWRWLKVCNDFRFTDVLLLLQLFYCTLSRTTWVSWYQKKHSPTHLSWSSSNIYQLLPSTRIHSILCVQFTCLTIFLHNVCPSPLWFTSWSGALHLILYTFFTQSVSCFRNTWPIPSQVYCLLIYSSKKSFRVLVKCLLEFCLSYCSYLWNIRISCTVLCWSCIYWRVIL